MLNINKYLFLLNKINNKIFFFISMFSHFILLIHVFLINFLLPYFAVHYGLLKLIQKSDTPLHLDNRGLMVFVLKLYLHVAYCMY